MKSDRVLSIFRAWHPTVATQKVAPNGFVEGTLKRVAEYLVTLIVPIVPNVSETPAQFTARCDQYEHGAVSCLFLASLSVEESTRLGEHYTSELTVSVLHTVPHTYSLFPGCTQLCAL